jgi:Na+-driven multidrug efflux pump
MNTNWTHPLEGQSVGKAFISYLVPSVLGMLVVAFNFIIDGIMVGHKLGSTAMAGIGIASPVYTLFVAMDSSSPLRMHFLSLFGMMGIPTHPCTLRLRLL